MSDQYVGEIRPVGFNFAPQDWLPCDGSLLSISDYEALFQLIGTTYGGDGQTTFALPDLRGRSPIGMGSGSGLPSYALGQSGGTESVTLTSQQIASHSHPIAAQDSSNASTQPGPGGNYFGNSQEQNQYASGSGNVITAPLLLPFGGSQSHENRMPFQAQNFIIAVNGIYPPRS